MTVETAAVQQGSQRDPCSQVLSVESFLLLFLLEGEDSNLKRGALHMRKITYRLQAAGRRFYMS